eukprot:m.239211 g.239211  ORF g.239211 m.239211 type:complete len:402 (-) comp16064_c0_seq1:1714-2919(-)
MMDGNNRISFRDSRPVPLRNVHLTPPQKEIITNVFNSAADEDGTIELEEVEKLTAQILNGAMSDAILDIVFDLTDEKDKINLDVFLEVIEAVLSRTCNWGSLETSTHGPVGIDSLVDQVTQRAKKRGFAFNIMVAGRSGLGKTTLVNTLFRGPVIDKGIRNENSENSQTARVETRTHVIEEGGMRVKLSITDTPGFGDKINNTDCFKPVLEFLKSQHESFILADLSKKRPTRIPDSRVHALLYFIEPSAYGLKELDIAFLRSVHHLVNVIPLLAKSDGLTLEERSNAKMLVCDALDRAGIQTFPWPLPDDDDSDEETKQVIKANLPFAIVGATDVITIDGQKQRGRQTSCGFVDVDNPKHCEFSLLRDTLIRTHMLDLMDATETIRRAIFLDCVCIPNPVI